MNKMRSLTEDLINQVSKVNPIIKITDFYPMESVVFYLEELDVGGLSQFLSGNKEECIRVTYVAADASRYEFIIGDVYSEKDDYYGRIFVANQQLIRFLKPDKNWQEAKYE